MRINTNMNAMIATNQMSKNTALSGKSMEKLSTGLRITKAGDDAAGLAISCLLYTSDAADDLYTV